MNASATLVRPIGQDALLERIAGAVEAGRLPQSLLVHGPEGVGKRAVALWTAAAIQCPSESKPCGTCQSCKLSGRLGHPDVHLHFPMPRPKRASSRAKLREAIEAQRQERLVRLREDAEVQLDEGEATGLYVAAVENIRHQASRRPAMGPRAVFIVHDADLMVPQSSSPEAANAFLKLLEEPPEFAYIILTSSRPDALLPTIRSRTAPLRVAPIPEALVRQHLVDACGATTEEASYAARRSGGAVGRARALWESGASNAAEAGDRLLGAALSGSARRRFVAAGEYSARGARATLQPALEELRARLRDVLADASGAGAEVSDRAALDTLVQGRALAPRSVIGALDAVEEALAGASRNLNPQSTVSVLLGDLQRAFTETSP